MTEYLEQKPAKVSVDEVIKFLNDLLAIDPYAIQSLITTRVLCNKKLAEHPTVQVQHIDEGNFNLFGILGLLNGLFGIDANGVGFIAAVVDADDNISEFIKLGGE